MWTPADITALPTAQDLIDAQSAIKEVEIELKDALLALEQAKLRVNRIRQNLWERRAWIAPIRRLNSDVLSLVFEFCGEYRWKTPLRIAGVSRHWRDLVLATPRAWAFLDVHKCYEDGDTQLIRHFFKHSAPQPLHVYLTKSQRLCCFLGNIGIGAAPPRRPSRAVRAAAPPLAMLFSDHLARVS